VLLPGDDALLGRAVHVAVERAEGATAFGRVLD
jgi:hypothetical protein